MDGTTVHNHNNTSIESFLSLLKVHQDLHELFFKHQSALLDGNISRALDYLAQYEQEAVEHIRIEEKLLLPVYSRRKFVQGGAPGIFTSEHKKILNYLKQFKSILEELIKNPNDIKKSIIALLDEETMFKKVFHHHDQREEDILYPALDEITSEEERHNLLLQCLPGALYVVRKK